MFPKIGGFTPKSSILLIGFSIINPFILGKHLIFGNTYHHQRGQPHPAVASPRSALETSGKIAGVLGVDLLMENLTATAVFFSGNK